MAKYRIMTVVVTLTVVPPGVGLATAAPAFAGGVGAIASPALDNTCVTLRRATRSIGQVVNAPGLGNGVAQAPVSVPYQHCGGADAPDLTNPAVVGQLLLGRYAYSLIK